MSVEDSTVVTAPLSTDASWLVLRVPRDRSAVLLWERSPGLGQLEALWPWAEVTAAADVVGWQRMAVGQHPWAERAMGQASREDGVDVTQLVTPEAAQGLSRVS